MLRTQHVRMPRPAARAARAGLQVRRALVVGGWMGLFLAGCQGPDEFNWGAAGDFLGHAGSGPSGAAGSIISGAAGGIISGAGGTSSGGAAGSVVTGTAGNIVSGAAGTSA